MKKWMGRHRGSLIAFSVTMLAAALAGGAMRVHAAAILGQQSNLSVVSHSHGCFKMSTSTGTPNVFGNGIKNVGAVALELACPLTSPHGGFDLSNDYVGADVNDQDNDPGVGVEVKACFTTRAVTGTGCGTMVTTSSSSSTSTGLYGVEVSFNAVGDSGTDASHFVDIKLPRQDVAASVLRAYGYYDADGASSSTLQSAIDAEVTARIAAVSAEASARASAITSEANARSAADSTINSTLTNHETRITALEAP